MYVGLWTRFVSNNITGKKNTAVGKKTPQQLTSRRMSDRNKSVNVRARKSCDHVTFIRGFSLAVTLRVCPAGRNWRNQKCFLRNLKGILNFWSCGILPKMKQAYLIHPSSPMYTQHLMVVGLHFSSWTPEQRIFRSVFGEECTADRSSIWFTAL